MFDTAHLANYPGCGMTTNQERRRIVQLPFAALAALTAAYAGRVSGSENARPVREGGGSVHDFDFFLGTWKVAHRRLKLRLANNREWEAFTGTTTCQSLLGGSVNLNEGVSHRAGRTFRGMGLRAFDARTGQWADWYLDANNPTTLGAPGIGRFANGIGTFLSDEEFEGRPIRVRGIFTPISASEAQWEQAFSPDGGATWETNWVMRYTRTA